MDSQWTMPIAQLAITILLTVIPWSFSEMPIVWRCTLWGAAWIIGLHLAFTTIPYARTLPTMMRVFLSLGLSGFLAAALYFPVLGMYREQKAGLTAGELHAVQRWKRGQEPSNPMYCIGIGKECVVRMVWGGPKGQPQFQLSQEDMNINVEIGEHEFLFSTLVRDRNGNLVVEINRNRWRVYPPYCSDKNYTSDTLEVKDSRGRVVLQARITKAQVEFQAEWNDQHGNGTRWRNSPDEKQKGAFMYIWRNAQMESAYDQFFLRPMFRYPSSEHWGEYADN